MTESEAAGENVEAIGEDMDVIEANGGKRSRGEEDGNEELVKRQKVDKSVEEERLEKKVEEEIDGNGEEKGEEEEEEKEEVGPVTLGPKSFGSSVEMFDYFYKFLHFWPPHVKINKYEHMVLLDLLKKGHPEPDKKIGSGIRAFQVQNHPTFKSRCFFLIRDDDSFDDFSFRKCVDNILPLPEDMKAKPDANKLLGGRKGRGGRGRGGRGKRW
ncbi:hypothetical protein K2173_028166 [Erythroxylum novogranatense]|uniref:Uncharacterized protein n=1 Tax=Erythroxylum novogranatense TaxID=1862640 RepID=A0AAV8U433_9ROSI|nr:hypothetical protein K2173_028166 [Erythroxylum novogranatense]